MRFDGSTSYAWVARRGKRTQRARNHIMSRFNKGVALLFNTQHSLRTVVPRPWDRKRAPYYLVGSVENLDGHAGHTKKFRFDSRGVPYLVAPEGDRYSALVIARYALQMWSIAELTGNLDAQAKALDVLPWLVEASGASGVWDTGGALPPNTPSAIVQGCGISALVRFATVVHDSALERAIERAAERLVAPVAQSGTLDHLPEGPFLEEFATRSHVLNGCVYGLFGLYDLMDGLKCDRFREQTIAIEATLLATLHRFTARSGWSRYALDVYGRAPLASAHYHRSHIRLFTIISQRTGSETAARTVDRWKAAHGRPVTRAVVALSKSLQVIWDRDVRRLPLR